jgi:hypothetical protein
MPGDVLVIDCLTVFVSNKSCGSFCSLCLVSVSHVCCVQLF